MTGGEWIATLLPALVGAIVEAGLYLFLCQPLERDWNLSARKHQEALLRQIRRVQYCAGDCGRLLNDDALMAHPGGARFFSVRMGDLRRAVEEVKTLFYDGRQDLNFFRVTYHHLFTHYWGAVYVQWLRLGAAPDSLSSSQMARILRPDYNRFWEGLERAAEELRYYTHER